TARPDSNLARGYNWEYSAVVQREIRPRLSVTGGYYRRDFYNLQVTDNQNLSLSQWTPYTIATPTDTRLPLSGQPISMYTLTTGGFSSVVDTLATFSTKNRTTYNGVEFTANARGAKYLLFGGVTTDRRASTSCDGDNVFNGNTARDNPNSARF